ncbi:Lar family restriction alleviation protein [Christensenella minuta]|uniref:Lar family restriction alleviation protein n=1 Tax=Christensenella minuta TaxID=626937 RepID=UPI002A801F8D|nr:Lar family restriction alleviation protein [Christensenella minuta]MDY3750548.1 Lar family restriction alleviation protein [Christensenella minuta]
MNETAKLKSCPFCGGEAKIDQWDRDRKCVCCTQCHIYTQPYSEAEIAVEHWNRRATENPQPLALSELHEMEGEPVYVKCLTVPELSCWGHRDESSVTGHQGNFFDDDYGTVWQAYRTKPERSGK